MADFPTTLPAPQVQGYDLTPDDPVLRTNMEAGAGRSRRQFTDVPQTCTLSWVLTEAQLALFEAWHKYTALDGSGWFQINLANGLGLQSMEARFKGVPKKSLHSAGGMNWQVSAQVQVRNAPMLTAAEMDVALAYPPDYLTYGAANLQTLIHSTLPGYW